MPAKKSLQMILAECCLASTRTMRQDSSTRSRASFSSAKPLLAHTKSISSIHEQRSHNAHNNPQNRQLSTIGVSGEGTESKMPWKTYFGLRRSLLRTRKITTTSSTILSFVAASYYAFSNEFAMGTKVLWMDPMVGFPVAIIASSGAGYAIGGMAGELVWRAMNGREAKKMDQRDKDLYQKIERQRAQPAFGSIRTLPDYYGETIKNTQSYRKWLRKQIMFKKGIPNTIMDRLQA